MLCDSGSLEKRRGADRLNIGLYGGTFNPIHLGHMAVAEKALQLAELDKVILIPAGMPYQKDQSHVLPAHHRFEMASLACSSHPDITVSPIEINRSGPSYTIDTVVDFLHKIDRQKDRLWLIMGSDAFIGIQGWRNYILLANMCNFIVFRRGVDHKTVAAMANAIRKISDSAIRIFDSTTLPEVSSTIVRSRIKDGLPFEHLVDKRVYDYIIANRLYGVGVN